ncbi:MAG TPA: hypothetical protein VG916_05890 [Gemmatimonadaceae bacterium]|nr:hypothetical protein [Gemmatimonadaceae bacterium]
MNRRAFRWMASFLVLAVAATARAQDATPGHRSATGAQDAARTAAAVETMPSASTDDRDVPPGPTVERAAVGVRLHRDAPATPAPEPRRADTKQNEAMMIVGGAGLIVGAIIAGSNETAGTLVMVSGAAIGLFGLYKYLQ